MVLVRRELELAGASFVYMPWPASRSSVLFLRRLLVLTVCLFHKKIRTRKKWNVFCSIGDMRARGSISALSMCSRLLFAAQHSGEEVFWFVVCDRVARCNNIALSFNPGFF